MTSAAGQRQGPSTPRAILGTQWRRPVIECDYTLPDHVAAVAASQFARSVEALRRSKGTPSNPWTQSTLARRSGVSPNTIGRLEDGLTWPDLRTMGAIAAAMHQPMTVHIGLEDEALKAAGQVSGPDALLRATLQAPPNDVASAAGAIAFLLANVPGLKQQVDIQLGEHRLAMQRRHQQQRRR